MKSVKAVCYELLSSEDKAFLDRIDPERLQSSSSTNKKETPNQEISIPELVPLKVIKSSDSILSSFPKSRYFDRIRDMVLLMHQTLSSTNISHTCSSTPLANLPDIITSHPVFSPAVIFSADEDINQVHQHPSIHDPSLVLHSDLDDSSDSDEFIVVESVSRHFSTTATITESPHIAVSESELAQIKEEEILKIRIFLSTKFRVLSPFIHAVALVADAHALIGVEVVQDDAKREDTVQIFQSSVELYLHALMLIRNMLKTLDDLMSSILLQTSEISKLRYLKQVSYSQSERSCRN
jgi:hypothetical protein